MMMTKEEAYNNFWNKFGVPAYDELSVPKKAVLPYITYEMASDTFDNSISLSASIWTRGTSWKPAYEILYEIEERVLKGGAVVPYDKGAIWITSGSPWSRRLLDDNDDMIKRLYLNLTVEYI